MFDRSFALTKAWLHKIIHKEKWLINPSLQKQLLKIAADDYLISLADDDRLPSYIIDKILALIDIPLIPGSKSGKMITQIRTDLQKARHIHQARIAIKQNKSQSLIFTLPDELWLNIFSRLKSKQATFAISLACSYFYQIINPLAHYQRTKHVEIKHKSTSRSSLLLFSQTFIRNELIAKTFKISKQPYSSAEAIKIYTSSGSELFELTPEKETAFKEILFSKDGRWLLAIDYHWRIHVWDLWERKLKHFISNWLPITSLFAVNQDNFILVCKHENKSIIFKLNAEIGKLDIFYKLDTCASFSIAIDNSTFICGSHYNSGIYFYKFNIPYAKLVETKHFTVPFPFFPFQSVRAKRQDSANIIVTLNNTFCKFNHITNQFNPLMQWETGIKKFQIIGNQYICFTSYSNDKNLYLSAIDSMENLNEKSYYRYHWPAPILELNATQDMTIETLTVVTSEQARQYEINYLEEVPEQRGYSAIKFSW